MFALIKIICIAHRHHASLTGCVLVYANNDCYYPCTW